MANRDYVGDEKPIEDYNSNIPIPLNVVELRVDFFSFSGVSYSCKENFSLFSDDNEYETVQEYLVMQKAMFPDDPGFVMNDVPLDGDVVAHCIYGYVLCGEVV